MGTNDITTERQWAKQQPVLKEAMGKVLVGLGHYLSCASLRGLLVTQVFSFEENRAVEKFAAMMEQVVAHAGARYVKVPWTKEHTQKHTATPLKHFNEAGVKLLCAQVFSTVAAETPTGLGGESVSDPRTFVTVGASHKQTPPPSSCQR